MLINPIILMDFRLVVYRIFSKTFFKIWCAYQRRYGKISQDNRETPVILEGLNRPFWFHASSVGELESLTEIIFEVLSEGGSVVVTIFSESARNTLSRLLAEARRLSAEKGWVGKITGGFSPPEGEWEALLTKYNPRVCIVWKYEAWPDLWASLTRLKIPLVLLNAKSRSSLTWVKRILFCLGVPLPQLIITSTDVKSLEQMKLIFRHSRAFLSGDPRWDRIKRRSEFLNSRVKDLVNSKNNLPRPWIILGSAWISDLKLWPSKMELSARGFVGTLWVVPHQVDSQHLIEMEKYLGSKGYFFEKTSQVNVVNSKEEIFQRMTIPVVLVDETGILVELYGHCDAAYVGGGFGDGVHSAMEPGFFGLPIVCGPKNSILFPEIEALSEQGQLCIVNESCELMSWIVKNGCSLLNDKYVEQREKEKDRRKDFWKTHTGESKRLMQLIQDSLGS